MVDFSLSEAFAAANSGPEEKPRRGAADRGQLKKP
jgi:hypothetical protein